LGHFKQTNLSCSCATIIPVKDQPVSINLIGVPLDLGAESLGVEVGPEALRQKKIVEKLEHVGVVVHDEGNLSSTSRTDLQPGDPNLPYADEIARVNKTLAEITEKRLREGHKVVAIGGDHSINLGVMSGASVALSGKLGLIYIDAHGDMNTPDKSISHNIHGMHLASLMGFGPEQLSKLYSPDVKLQTNNLLHIAGSDFDQGEIDLIKQENLTCFTMFDLLSNSLSPLFKMIDDLKNRVENIWVSVDLDAIDYVYAPGVGIPNHGGLTYREIAAITDYIGKHCNVVGIDLVEYNPMKDIEGKTAELGIELVAKLLGTNYSWYTNYMDQQSK